MAIEHEKITVTFCVDRGIANQIIRHRIASYSQELTRYCNYLEEKFGQEITVIEPFFIKIEKENIKYGKRVVCKLKKYILNY